MDYRRTRQAGLSERRDRHHDVEPRLRVLPAADQPAGLPVAPGRHRADSVRRDARGERRFTPEFRNRIDEVVIFQPLSREEVRAIACLQIERLSQSLAKSGRCFKSRRQPSINWWPKVTASLWRALPQARDRGTDCAADQPAVERGSCVHGDRSERRNRDRRVTGVAGGNGVVGLSSIRTSPASHRARSLAVPPALIVAAPECARADWYRRRRSSTIAPRAST